ncbi:uncharacterized protein LOC106756396 isoform X2 [Vigna radiata var. radiata]|uniref:Uncharacterized protein LOC106756396 isoform X2 n=1 Tax=Vigna radiata var. radiata TaxID=3916 RepID=A0A3Q0EQE5_VIGRR|nr:uncharacterized protein LOC106756396 isoform X2 [Vigna radiata var. radiata]
MLLKMGMGEAFAMSKIRREDLVKRVVIMAVMAMFVVDAADTNDVYSPCLDTKVQKGDGFTFGIAFSDKQVFSPDNGPQLSPCDKRLELTNKGAQVAVFRPKVDEISLLTINRSTLDPVLEFQEGTLQNLYWKSFGCDACPKGSSCLNQQDCAVPNTECQKNGENICNIGIQLTFSGTDRNLDALNSWYEVKNLRQYSLYGLFSDLRDSMIGPYEKLF